MVSPDHERILKEAVRNLPNLEALNLQLGIFNVDRRLWTLVTDSMDMEAIKQDKYKWRRTIWGAPLTQARVAQMHRRSFVTSRIYWKFLEILYYPRTPVKILDVEGSGLIQAGYHDSWQTDLQQLFKDITTLRFCFKSTAPAESVNSERCRIYREEPCREKFFGSYIPLHLHFFRCVERLTIINANPDPATEDIQPPSFEFLMRISSDSELVVHTFHLEGVHINSVNLLRLCKYCHATLKNFSMRRISLLGDWRSVVSDLKKGDVKLRLETFYMRDLWEESAEGVKKKLPAEVVRKLVHYMLGPEDSELVLEY